MGADGVAQLDLKPGTKNDLEIQFRDPLTQEINPTVSLPVSVDASPPPSTHPVWYVMLTIATACVVTGVAIGANIALRRIAFAWIRGECWNVTVTECTIEGELECSGKKRQLTLRYPDQEDATVLSLDSCSPFCLPPAGQDLLEGRGNESIATLLIETDAKTLAELEFNSLSETERGSPLVTGVIPARFCVPGRPQSVRRLRIGVLSSASGDSASEIKAVRKRSAASGFKFLSWDTSTTPQDAFVNAVSQSHVVLMDGSFDSFAISGKTSFQDAIRGRNLQCRLMIFIAKEGNTTDRELLAEVAASGIQVVYAIGLSTSVDKQQFREAFIDSLLPTRGKRGQSLAQCIWDAASHFNGNESTSDKSQIAPTVSIILLGDPSSRVSATRTHDAFLSHSHKDRDEVVWLQDFLSKRWFWWKRRLNICRDETSFTVRRLGETIPERVAASRYLIVCCSPNAAVSHWVKREVRYFLRQHSVDNISICYVGEIPEGNEENTTLIGFEGFLQSKIGHWDMIRPDLRWNRDADQPLSRRNSPR